MPEQVKYSGDVNGQRRITCSTAGPLQVSVKNGRMIRIEPLQIDPNEADSWQCDLNGKTYKPPLVHPLLPWGMIGKQMAYGEERVRYPMKRVDWDPSGERNPQNRGKSGYERITWDEAFEILSGEMKRIIDTYGVNSLAYFTCAHPEWGSLHYFFSDWTRFTSMIGGTKIDFTPNSWEGWACGASMMWGFMDSQGVPAAPDSLSDITKNDDLIVLWGQDPMFHNLYGGVDQARLWKWWKELGKEVICIEPLYNETALAAADSWIPIYPGTDGALGCAIAYVWIKEGLYDQAYLDAHTIGFDEEHLPEGAPEGSSFKNYILGESDGVAKTPEWAEEHCGVPARKIRKLAREWGNKPTSFWILCGGAGRREFSDTFTRLMVTLAAMQGLGKPGSNVIGSFLSLSGPYDKINQVGPIGYANGGMNSVCQNFPMAQEFVPHMTFQKLLDCYERGSYEWYGGDVNHRSPAEYFTMRHYPEPGNNEVHFLWQRGSTMTNPPDRNRHLRFLRHPKMETFVVSAPWFDRDCHMADLVLPACTMYERSDLTEPASVGQYVPGAYIGLRTAIYHQQCIEPVGESKTDLQICAEIAKRFGLEDAYLEGNTEDSFLEKIFANTNIPLTYEEMKEKGYYVWPKPENYEENKQLKGFYEEPDIWQLATPSGKIEIFSTVLWDHYGNNDLIPPVPHYIPENEGHENLELRQKYPLQQLMAHPKFRFHGKYNNCSWIADAYKVKGPDGYKYEPAMINPVDAEARGIKSGDIVRVYNDRGSVLAGAVVTSRMRPGVVQLTYGAWNDPLDGGHGAPDRGGDGSVVSNAGEMSPHHLSGAYNSSLIEVELADLEALAERYPEGWSGCYRTWNKEGK